MTTGFEPPPGPLTMLQGRVLRPVACCLLVTVAACASWRTEGGPPAEAIGRTRGVARLTLVAGDTLLLRDPRVDDDRIVGLRPRPPSDLAPPESVVVPLADVRGVERRVVSWPRTLLFVGGAALLFAVVVGQLGGTPGGEEEVIFGARQAR